MGGALVVMRPRNGPEMNSWRDAILELNEGLTGPSFVDASPGYEDVVAVFNQAAAHQPALVVGAENAATRLPSTPGCGCSQCRSRSATVGRPEYADDHDQTNVEDTRRRAQQDGSRRCGGRFGELGDAAGAHGLEPLPVPFPGVGVVGYALGAHDRPTGGRRCVMGSTLGHNLFRCASDGGSGAIARLACNSFRRFLTLPLWVR